MLRLTGGAVPGLVAAAGKEPGKARTLSQIRRAVRRFFEPPAYQAGNTLSRAASTGETAGASLPQLRRT